MAEPTPSERFEELQRQVNQRVQQALSELRQEFGERLRKAGDQILGELGREIEGVSPELPASFLSADELAPLAAEAGERAQRDAHGLLTSALAAVDRAGSQAEVLRVLARETRRFADRSAVFLTREDGLELWDSAGWGEGDDAVDEVALPYAERGPWSRDALESGAAELSAAEAANLCERTGQETPAAAALVPLVLRDRLAAVLYADVERSGAPQLEALQALAYTAALALETLPFRERASTPTLRHGGTAAATPAERPPSIAVEPAEPAEAPPEDVPTAAEPSAPFTAEPAGEEEEMEIAAEEAEEGDDVEDAGAGAWTLEDEEEQALTGEGPQAEVGELEVSEPEELEIDEAAPAFETDFDDDLEVDVDLDADLELEDELEGGDLDTGLDTEIEVDEPDIEGPEVEEPEIEEPAVEEPEIEEEPELGVEPDSPAATAGFEAPSPQPAPAEPPAPPPESEPPAPTPEESPPSPPEKAPPAGGSQVAPPSDLEGPGRAFGAAEEPASDDEARHEEARRLARLLVSEIRLYNEEEVEEGRRNNDIYQRLKEDIDRSRQMYDERVDPTIRDSTDYFYQELVRNLGGGDAATLGI